MAHLYASFADASLAEKAAGALLDYGVRQEDISLVAHDDYGKTRQTYGTETAGTGYSDHGTAAHDAGRGASNLADSAVDATKSVGDRVAQAGDRVAGAVTGAVGATGSAAGYNAAADARAGMAEGRAGMAAHESAVHGGVGVFDNTNRTDLDPMNADDRTVHAQGDMNPLDQGGPDSAANNTDLSAKHGISTTTPEDAGEGAVKGTGIGLGLGILASLAALTIPGVGLVLGGGALAAALGATALTAGAGALAGGATGYLKEQGVPTEAAERYHGTVTGGGAVLSLNVPSGNVDQAAAEQVLAKYGASDVNAY